MRIVKLSAKDHDFPTREHVDTYFCETLHRRNGQFFLSPRSIGKKGISQGEQLLFAYEGDCVYMARVASLPEPNEGPDKENYPSFFRVDVNSIEQVQGALSQVQIALVAAGHRTKLARSQSWPKFRENGKAARLIVKMVSPRPNKSKIEPEPGGATPTDEQGAGFGDPQTNPEVEQAAVRFVTSRHKDQGWTVISVETKKIGYDLRCTKGVEEKHIEVKGVRGDWVCFLLTANEKSCAERDKLFCVCVVTRALTDSPKCIEIPGAALLAHYEFQPVNYRVTQK